MLGNRRRGNRRRRYPGRRVGGGQPDPVYGTAAAAAHTGARDLRLWLRSGEGVLAAARGHVPRAGSCAAREAHPPVVQRRLSGDPARSLRRAAVRAAQRLDQRREHRRDVPHLGAARSRLALRVRDDADADHHRQRGRRAPVGVRPAGAHRRLRVGHDGRHRARVPYGAPLGVRPAPARLPGETGSVRCDAPRRWRRVVAAATARRGIRSADPCRCPAPARAGRRTRRPPRGSCPIPG